MLISQTELLMSFKKDPGLFNNHSPGVYFINTMDQSLCWILEAMLMWKSLTVFYSYKQIVRPSVISGNS